MADICLVLEGSYPYITGGVSSWVHNLIKSLSQIRFSLLTIVPSHDTYREFKYEVPENVVGLTEVPIHDYNLSTDSRRGSTRQAYRSLGKLYQEIKQRDYSRLQEVYRLVGDPETRVVSPGELFFDKRTWELLVEEYGQLELEESFVDYFWTWRYSHLPILRMLDANIPSASVYHTISTGYAGLAAVLAHYKTGAPVILTEHGIYTNERRIEIEQARWIYERKVDRTVITETVSPFRQMWIMLFDHLGRITYRHSEEIITLFGNNRRLQIAGGAEPKRTRIIPNGINLSRFKIKKEPGKTGGKKQVGFIGRVVPIKDVKTFIRACKIVREQCPEASFPIIGPTDEDEEYFNECRELVEMLGLDDCVEFTGRVNVVERYPQLDVVVLTSVSEGQPLVLLEANCCGVPCVATDVGASSELLNGLTPEDRALGQSGLITSLANPQATAEATIRLLSNDKLREEMGRVGIQRVERFYDEQELNFAYLNIYRKYLG
jgi:polysaccharide biosynthesis protein PelF